MPRVYTIKTILSALDRDLDDLQQDTMFETKVKEAMLLEIDDSKSISFLLKNLHLGWITGILSMIAFVFQLIEDSYFIAEGDYYFGGEFYIILGIISIVLFALHMRAFVLIGNLFKSYLLKVTAILFIAGNSLLILYAIIDLYFVYLPQGAYAIIFCLFYGLLYDFFGYALVKIRGLGQLPKAAGIMQIIIGGMFLTILFSIVTAPASILVQGLNVAIILKTIEVLKKQVTSEQ